MALISRQFPSYFLLASGRYEHIGHKKSIIRVGISSQVVKTDKFRKSENYSIFSFIFSLRGYFVDIDKPFRDSFEKSF